MNIINNAKIHVYRKYVNRRYKNDIEYKQKIDERLRKYLFMKRGLSEVSVYRTMNEVFKIYKNTSEIFPSESILEFISKLRKDKRSYSTIRNIRGVIKSLCLFWNIEIDLGKFKKPETLVKDCLKKEEIQQIIKNCKSAKDKAIITLISYTGIRMSELRNVKIKHININELCVFIDQGKNHRDRVVCINKDCADVLQEYLNVCNKEENEYLFSDKQNRKLSSKLLRRLFRETKEKTNITKHLYVHLFRHSLATNMLLEGADLVSVQRQLGHKNIQTTLNYINFTPEIYRKQYEKYVPAYLTKIN